MVQAGGFDAALNYRVLRPRPQRIGREREEPTRYLAMARQRDPDSADSQFFINLVDNAHLDAEDDRPGYTVLEKSRTAWR